MSFSKRKIIFGTLGATLATGFAVVSSNYPSNNKVAPQKPQEKQTLNKVKLRTKYEKSLIGNEMNFWKNRFEELKLGNPKHSDLLKTQTLNIGEGINKLREVCEEINDENEDSEFFEDFKNFCVMKNKDASNLISSKEDLNSKYNSFSKANRKNLSEAFAKIWDQKGNSATEDWKQKMFDECKRLQEKIYLGDSEDDDFESYCART